MKKYDTFHEQNQIHMGFYGYCKDSRAKKNNVASGSKEAVMEGETPCL